MLAAFVATRVYCWIRAYRVFSSTHHMAPDRSRLAYATCYLPVALINLVVTAVLSGAAVYLICSVVDLSTIRI